MTTNVSCRILTPIETTNKRPFAALWGMYAPKNKIQSQKTHRGVLDSEGSFRDDQLGIFEEPELAWACRRCQFQTIGLEMHFDRFTPPPMLFVSKFDKPIRLPGSVKRVRTPPRQIHLADPQFHIVSSHILL